MDPQLWAEKYGIDEVALERLGWAVKIFNGIVFIEEPKR